MANDVIAALRRVPLLSVLHDRELERVARDFTERTFPAGATVVTEGERSGIGFFVIREGEAVVSVGGSEAGRLGPGDHFGELALISDRVRTATVTAETDLRCLVTAVWEFRSFVKGNPEVAWGLLEHVVQLLHESRRAKIPA